LMDHDRFVRLVIYKRN